MNPVFVVDETDSFKIKMSSLLRKNPTKKEMDNSNINKPKNLRLNWIPLKIASAMEELVENNIITKTSIMTVTPSMVLVNGPFALSSLIMAMADDGERATRIEPAKIETATRFVTDISFINGIKSESKKRAHVQKTKVVTIRPAVIQAMLFNFFFSSFK